MKMQAWSIFAAIGVVLVVVGLFLLLSTWSGTPSITRDEVEPATTPHEDDSPAVETPPPLEFTDAGGISPDGARHAERRRGDTQRVSETGGGLDKELSDALSSITPARRDGTVLASFTANDASITDVVYHLRREAGIPISLELPSSGADIPRISLSLKEVSDKELMHALQDRMPQYEVKRQNHKWIIIPTRSPLRIASGRFSVEATSVDGALAELAKQVQLHLDGEATVGASYRSIGRSDAMDTRVSFTLTGNAYDALNHLVAVDDRLIWQVGWKDGAASVSVYTVPSSARSRSVTVGAPR